jgi:hypothetical protein
VEPATDTQAPVTGQNGPAGAAGGPNARSKPRNVKYPIQLRVNITPAMAASVARLAQYREMPEGIICREILKQSLLQLDPQYRADIGVNTRNQQHG